MSGLRARLAFVGIVAAVGVLLLSSGLAADRALPAVAGLLLLGSGVVGLAPITPRGGRQLARVVGLMWAVLQRVENGEPVAPESIQRARRLNNGALLLVVRYPVGAAPLSKRMSWLRGALGVAAAEPFEATEETARVVQIVVGGAGA
ncbi:hypothetical protein [Microbacterium sp. RG1]|uniref:hypothetical protein n=1 Tax=Microbacterium sp. RG1 TaxID=2489212 RepID=UPI0010CA49A7|nr:hypothetical protein [Microbacterium sp. RG1]QCQ17247.1 hypothetical protein EHF32_11225 [Microbacterium sp. RG1]